MNNAMISQVNEKKFFSLRALGVAGLAATLCAAATAQVAHVYVSTSKGIEVYDAASNGILTQVSGSPFRVSGAMTGSNGKYLLTLGSSEVSAYKLGSNGAIGDEASSIDTQSYSGGKCGTTAGAVLDHSGEDLYVLLKGTMADDGNELCDAVQTSGVSTSGGLSYKGDLMVDEDQKYTGSDTLPVFLGNNKFAYSLESETDSCQTTLNMFAREGSGALEFAGGQNVNYPEGPSGGYYYYPMYPSNVSGEVGTIWPSLITDDSSNHLAIALFAMNDAPCGNMKAPQLGSFTADSKGDLSSTNTAENMPSVPGGINVMRMSPAGNLLAVSTGTGVQIFHFNGAAPITKFTGIIGTSGWVSDLQWDKNNHLYAINGASGNLHVYTVTTSSVTEAAGSPYAIGASSSATGLVVVSE